MITIHHHKKSQKVYFSCDENLKIYSPRNLEMCSTIPLTLVTMSHTTCTCLIHLTIRSLLSPDALHPFFPSFNSSSHFSPCPWLLKKLACFWIPYIRVHLYETFSVWLISHGIMLSLWQNTVNLRASKNVEEYFCNSNKWKLVIKICPEFIKNS